jgi:hypothetical protein
MEHPRFGSIMSVYSRIPIEAGSEIFAFYGYKKAMFPSDFPWYFKQLEEIEKVKKKKRKKQKK